ncbi:30S ribosomal protein S16 [Xiashengella succiniciproducens]|jgi:small subunit ribosomal protein S16|uniref:Small ribosomal subunit protein bS16 n=1 Tax=Xiashengella succiniciproducens TaxID=2949635 RepID=A0A9J6ZRT1_9BACT|nr:30S ribosomal protein S16 [Alkaliflexus sp. Ai-910]URW79936.1 30S ribosomal protein S16 [Alkaliflexus sp. Ai-910]HHU01039.1 30S ribosomal protein S16 [Bacteroidales bacterium]
MSVKIRLTRRGRKGYAFYHIVVADSRAPRDGRYIERIGSYNPNTNPATIEVDIDKALKWINNGAQPTDTARSLLSAKGVLMKKHLLEGVKKGAFDEAEAERRFQLWLDEKAAKAQAKKEQLDSKKSQAEKEKLAQEAKVNAARAEKIAKKKAEQAAEVAEEAASEEATEAPAESPASEEPQAE